MQKSSQINIRFDPETEAQLNAVAEELGVTKSALIRRLTEKFLCEVKRTGAAALNPAWVADLTRADARAKWGERKVYPMPESSVAEDSPKYRTTKKPDPI